jgi:hypothetical protein
MAIVIAIETNNPERSVLCPPLVRSRLLADGESLFYSRLRRVNFVYLHFFVVKNKSAKSFGFAQDRSAFK